MKEAGNVELGAHIRGELGERRPVHKLEVDWGDGVWHDLTPVTREVSVHRSRTGDLPEEAGLIEGTDSAELSAKLEGTWIDSFGREWPITTALAPWVPGNLRAGHRLVEARVRASMGMVLDAGPELLQVFYGVIRDLDGSAGEGVVEVSGVDNSDRLRAKITLPTFAEFISHVVRRPWSITVNTMWILDHCLRANGIYQTPALRGSAIIACTGHGGLVSELGYNGAPISIYGTGPTAGLWVEDSHPYGMMGTSENTSGGTVGYQEFYGGLGEYAAEGYVPVFFEGGEGVGIQFLLHTGNYLRLGSSFENRIWQLRPTPYDTPRLFVNGFGNGDIYAGLVLTNGAIYATPRIPTGSSRWRFVGVHFQWTSNTTLVIRVRMDGQLRTYTITHPVVGVPTTDFVEGYRPMLCVRGYLFRAWSDMQTFVQYEPPTTTTAQGPWYGEQWIPEAKVRRGLNELAYLPDVSSADSWEVMKAAVAAELGVHGFDDSVGLEGKGWYEFRPRTDVREDRDADVVIDVKTNLSDAKWSTTTDSVRNVIALTTQTKYHAGKKAAVVQAKDPLQFVCPVGYTRFEVDWPWGAVSDGGGILTYAFQDGKTSPTTGVGYNTQPEANGGTPKWEGSRPGLWTYSSGTNWTNANNTRPVVVGWVQLSPRTAYLRVYNPGPGPIRLATAADPANLEGSPGEGAVNLPGWPIEDQPERVAEVRGSDERIEADLGERVLPMTSSEWRQRSSSLRPVMAALLDALEDEVATLEQLEIVGDPRIEVGDIARLHFPDTPVPIYGAVVDHSPAAEDAGIVSTVSVRPLPALSLAPPGWVFYVDVSHYQGELAQPLDLARLRALGYAACVAKIGQGAGTTSTGATYGATVDDWWPRWRDEALPLWPGAVAGYWYVGNTEAAADQAQRCLDWLGDDPAMPIMLDWEEGGGSFSNLLAVLAAFRALGMRVTMLYTSSGYAAANGASNIDAQTGLHVVRARYWTNEQGSPRALFDDITSPQTFGLGSFSGATPDAWQFTQAGEVYPGMVIDVDAHYGTEASLGAMLRGDNLAALAAA